MNYMRFPKTKPYRSERLRRYPADPDVTCVNCGASECCLAHRSIPGNHGVSTKADDFFGAHLCQRCHDYGDGAKGRRDHEWWEQMIYRTQKRLFDAGVIWV